MTFVAPSTFPFMKRIEARLSRVTELWSRDGLPEDVLDEEVTVVVLFKLSVLINRKLGGEPEMTFSARTFIRSDEADYWLKRLVWRFLLMVIDFACAVTRGETAHCEAAWQNHMKRGANSNFLAQ